MRAGSLNQRVEFLERQVGTLASSGLQTEAFVVAFSAWARVTNPPPSPGGGEGFDGAQRIAEETHRFRIRYRSEIDPTWRVRWRGTEYEITRVTPGGQQLREYLDVSATAGPAENPNR